MNQDNDNFKRIKQFLDNEMSLDKRSAFEEEMKTDESLSTEVAEQKLLTDGLYSIERNRLKAKALKWVQKSDAHSIDPVRNDTQSSNLFSMNRILGIAASLLLLASAGYVLFFNKSQDAQELVNTHFASHHQDPVVLRGVTTNPAWSDAIVDYRNRDFDNMISSMQDDVYTGQANIEQLFYFGLAYMYKQPPELDSTLYYLSKTNVEYNRTFRNEAAWYEALIFIKQGDMSAAKLNLNALVKTQNNYSNKAKELLISINQQ